MIPLLTKDAQAILTTKTNTKTISSADQADAAQRRTYDLAYDLTWLTYSSIDRMDLLPVVYQDETKKQKLLQDSF